MYTRPTSRPATPHTPASIAAYVRERYAVPTPRCVLADLRCRYCDANGTCGCPVGGMLTLEDAELIEGSPIGRVFNELNKKGYFTDDCRLLLHDLQSVHDQMLDKALTLSDFEPVLARHGL